MAAVSGGQQAGGVHNPDTMKKMFARQRAKDLAEHAKQMLSKDREIEDLRSKCQELADTLSNADFLGPEVNIRSMITSVVSQVCSFMKPDIFLTRQTK